MKNIGFDYSLFSSYFFYNQSAYSVWTLIWQDLTAADLGCSSPKKNYMDKQKENVIHGENFPYILYSYLDTWINKLYIR